MAHQPVQRCQRVRGPGGGRRSACGDRGWVGVPWRGQEEDPDYGNARANLDKARRNLAARAPPVA